MAKASGRYGFIVPDSVLLFHPSHLSLPVTKADLQRLQCSSKHMNHNALVDNNARCPGLSKFVACERAVQLLNDIGAIARLQLTAGQLHTLDYTREFDLIVESRALQHVHSFLQKAIALSGVSDAPDALLVRDSSGFERQSTALVKAVKAQEHKLLTICMSDLHRFHNLTKTQTRIIVPQAKVDL